MLGDLGCQALLRDLYYRQTEMYALTEAFGGLSEKNSAARKAPVVFSLTPRRVRPPEGGLLLL